LKSRADDGLAKATLTHAKMDMRRFVQQFGTRLLAITPDEIRAWLAALPYAAVTKRNHYKRVSAFYTWARLEGLASANPCENVRSPARDSDDVSVLKLADAKELFRTARKLRPQVCARLALEAFAGLRYSSAARLVKADINFADRGITLPAAKLKTRKRHYIDGLPENLWKWLRAAPDEAWALTERQYLSLSKARPSDSQVSRIPAMCCGTRFVPTTSPSTKTLPEPL
jgi:site-specific recombinase XerD